MQGDTTTVLASSLATFYQKIKVIHIEAGLRNHDVYCLFPEEMNRQLASRIANIHFCQTILAKKNLKDENCKENAFVVGNTVIDALFMGLEKIKNEGYEKQLLTKYNFIDFSKKIILVTCHRGENFGEPFNEICDALLEISSKEKNNVEIIFPVHLNPNILEIAHKKLIASNIKSIIPLEYPELIWIMNKSYLIITDYGGIQEEAPSLGKPVVVIRKVTERTEGVESGNAVLIGYNCKLIIAKTVDLLNNKKYYNLMTSIQNPYGDGTTCTKIKETLSLF